MTEPISSKYADLLNALSEMQDSMAYAVRKPVLIQAEHTIVDLARAKDALAEKVRELGETAEAWRLAAEASEARLRSFLDQIPADKISLDETAAATIVGLRQQAEIGTRQIQDLEERLGKQTDYSIHLQQLIESLRQHDSTPHETLYHHAIVRDCKERIAQLEREKAEVGSYRDHLKIERDALRQERDQLRSACKDISDERHEYFMKSEQLEQDNATLRERVGRLAEHGTSLCYGLNAYHEDDLVAAAGRVGEAYGNGVAISYMRLRQALKEA